MRAEVASRCLTGRIWTAPARLLDDACDDRLRLQPYLRPLEGALALRAMKEIAHGEPIAIERPVAARQVIGFPLAPVRAGSPSRRHARSRSW